MFLWGVGEGVGWVCLRGGSRGRKPVLYGEDMESKAQNVELV